MVDGRWLEVESPSDSDDFAYINPNVKLEGKSIFGEALSLNPGIVENQSTRSEWDTIVDGLSAPEAVGVDRVGIDFQNGLVDVQDSKGTTTYVLAALGDGGSMSLIDESGNISTSEVSAMPFNHHMAIVEAVQRESRVVSSNDVDVGFGGNYADLYGDVINSGSFEALGGDVLLKGFDSVKGVPKYESDNDAAENLFKQLNDIAEFYRDFEEDYNISDQLVDPNMPITPERKAGNNSYKFRLSGTDRDSNIVVSNDYDFVDGVLELDVAAFGNHKGPANSY